MTEVEGKATGWKAYYNAAGWVAEGSGKPAAKKKAKAKPRAKSKSKAAASSKSKK
jgi:DNA topoisomerase-1